MYFELMDFTGCNKYLYERESVVLNEYIFYGLFGWRGEGGGVE